MWLRRISLCCDLSCACREKNDLDNQRGGGRYIKSEKRGRQSSTNLLGRQLINRLVYLEQEDLLRSSCKKSLEAKLKSVNDESKFYSVGSGKTLKTFLEEKWCFCEINLMALT